VKFHELYTCRKDYFSMGIEEDSGNYYLSIPVSNQLVDYEEYYRIDKKTFELYQQDSRVALEFVEKCRQRLNDDLLIIKPGKDRGCAF
jgi:hypothetical protein